MDYIDRIRALRKAQGLTQKDMADVLGVATSMYNICLLYTSRPPRAEVIFYSFAQQGCKKRPELRHLRFNVFIIADKIYKRQESIRCV